MIGVVWWGLIFATGWGVARWLVDHAQEQMGFGPDTKSE